MSLLTIYFFVTCNVPAEFYSGSINDFEVIGFNKLINYWNYPNMYLWSISSDFISDRKNYTRSLRAFCLKVGRYNWVTSLTFYCTSALLSSLPANIYVCQSSGENWYHENRIDYFLQDIKPIQYQYPKK